MSEHQLCESETCHRRECRMNRQDTERAYRWADAVVSTKYNRRERRALARGFRYRNRPRPPRHPLAMS